MDSLSGKIRVLEKRKENCQMFRRTRQARQPFFPTIPDVSRPATFNFASSAQNKENFHLLRKVSYSIVFSVILEFLGFIAGISLKRFYRNRKLKLQ